MFHLDKPFEIKDVSTSGTFAGYGSVYGNLDQGDDIVAPGAFADSLKSYAAKGSLPALLWQHKQSEPIGTYTAMREDDHGLYVEGKLALKTQRGAEAYELMQMKAISGMSIGFQTIEDDFDRKSGVRTILKGDLWEVSLVTFPMNDAARVMHIKSIEEVVDFKSAERLLRDAGGFSRSEAVALVSRIKSLTQSESVDEDETRQLIKALALRTQLLTL